MPLSLVRIDDRLIHGQVVLGWARMLEPDRIIVANNRIATNPRERKIYSLGVPSDIKVSFLTLDETTLELLNNLYQSESVIVLFESVRDIGMIIDKGVQLETINVGGLHHREGAEELLPYVFLTDEDREFLREFVKKGITLLAQDIPGNAAKVINSMVV